MLEDDLCAVGFMFDAEHDRETRIISFTGGIEVTLKTIGDKPGHVQSGQYLWPAAQAAGEYLIANWDLIGSSRVLELGAGCGLSGVVASKLPGVDAVVWSDYDPGTLQLIEENAALNCSCKCFVHFLEWGKPIEWETRASNEYPTDGFRLVIGSDLIYCKEVIAPLLRTVAKTLSRDGVFVLTSSFALDELSEVEMTRACKELGIFRELRVPLDESRGVSKVEHYRCTSRLE